MLDLDQVSLGVKQKMAGFTSRDPMERKCDTVLWTSLDWGYGIWDTINKNQTDRAIVWGLYLGIVSHIPCLIIASLIWKKQTWLAKTDIC